jgi:3-hydroxyacyl-CoA dehydrogenase/enoyl-CoA hydratase/3-hydroxybutyryl-CoA epimerase
MAAFTVDVRAGIALVALDVPGEAVNKITRTVREELDRWLDDFAGRDDVRAIVLCSGKSDTFIAGADIREFLALRTREEAHRLVRVGQRLVDRLERLGKPVVAAVHGACLGAGLEAVLACTYRIASNDPATRLGFPEIQLGIIPSAGGCQRLPRLIGIRRSLDLILTGRQISADRAHRLGIVDEVVHPAVLERGAVEAAHRLVEGWRPKGPRLKSARMAFGENAMGRRVVLSAARKRLHKRTGGHYPAPVLALEAVEHGLRHGPEAGLDMEATHFSELVTGDVSRNLMRLFFATTALKKDLGVDGEVPPSRPIERLAVVGAGFMGASVGGVAVLEAGTDVRLRDVDLKSVGLGIQTVRGLLQERLQRGAITGIEYRRMERMVSGGANWDGFARAGLVLEAVYEDAEVKRDVMRDIERRVHEDCIIASNTSTIPIHQLAMALARPDRLLGMHFFSPVEKMPLLEIIVTEQTEPWALVSAAAFGRRMGKTVIVAQDRPGFWVNRILAPYLNEAGRLVQEGVTVKQLDAAMIDFGFPVGPIALLDDIGWDVAEKATTLLAETFGDRMRPAAGVHRMTEEGRLGRKVGRGFYRFEQGARREVDQSAYEVVGAAPDSSIPREDVTLRPVYALLNEAACALDEGVVRQPRDADVGAVFGFGFPAFRGGPLRYIDALGVKHVVANLRGLAERYGERFHPCAALDRLATSGGSFHPDD